MLLESSVPSKSVAIYFTAFSFLFICITYLSSGYVQSVGIFIMTTLEAASEIGPDILFIYKKYPKPQPIYELMRILKSARIRYITEL